MTNVKLFLLPIALLAAPFAAHADDWREEGGHRRYDRAPKEVFWDGNCRVEQRVNRNGELVERRRCRNEGDVADTRRYADEDDARRVSAYRGSGRNADDADEREQPRYQAAPAPVYAEVEPVALAPRPLPRAAPAPRMVVHAQPIVKPAPVAPKIVAPVPAKAVRLASTRRHVVKAAPEPHPQPQPQPQPPRIVTQPAPEVKVTIILAQGAAEARHAHVVSAVQAPSRKQVLAPVIKVKSVARAEPAAKPAKPAPVVVEAVVATPHHAPKAKSLPGSPRIVAEAVATPAPLLKVVPAAPAPRVALAVPLDPAPVAVKAKPAVKTSETYPKSAWLVTLSPDEAKADDSKAAEHKAPTPKLGSYAINDKEVQDYVLRKSGERYSNLK